MLFRSRGFPRSLPSRESWIREGQIIPRGSRIHCDGSERGKLPLIEVVVMVVVVVVVVVVLVGAEVGEASRVRCLRAKAGSVRSK